MKEMQGELAIRALPDLVRDLHAAEATGTLEIEMQGQRRKLHFVRGEIYLPAATPLARRLAALLAEEHSDGHELTALVQRMVDLTSSWREGSYRFLESKDDSGGELVGPLPTLEFARLGGASTSPEAAEAPTESRPSAPPGPPATDPLAKLGGERARWITVPKRSGSFDPAEQWVLEQLRQPRTLRDLLEDSPVPRAELLETAAKLAAAGYLRSLDRPRVETGAFEFQSETLQRLRLRIASFLEEKPLDGDLESQRSRVMELLATREDLDHYQLLGIGPFASTDEVQRAYEEMARLVHPLRAEELGLAESAGALTELFDSMTTAYLTLSDNERRRDYDRQHGLGPEAATVTETSPTAARQEEREELARSYFERAMAYEARAEIHFAIEMLTLATATDPTHAEYFLNLGRLQARNPNWLRRAATSYLRGISLSPREIPPRLELARILEKLGELPRARVQYHTILRIDSTHQVALARRQELEERIAAENRGEGGLLGRFFRKG